MKQINPQKEKEQPLQQIELIFDFFHRTMMHHAFWFAEVSHQLGKEAAYKAMEEAWERWFPIQMKRLSKVLGFELADNYPAFLTEMSTEQRESLTKAVAVNWLALDGVWFQAVENQYGMNDAKRCNDSCWGQFSPLEATMIRKILNLPEKPGLEGLKKALRFRLYAFVNEQTFTEETENSFVFRMNHCRVQAARQRKGLPDYPCKSGGLVEYASFARTIDSRIKTEALVCPPDHHPDEYFCAWRFTIEE